MRIVVRPQASSAFLEHLRIASTDEGADTKKYAEMAAEAMRVVPGGLGTTVSGELASISEQEDSHKNALDSIIRAVQAAKGGAQVRRLPTVFRNGKQYFFDYKLKQLRNTTNPHEFIYLSPLEAEELRAQVGTAA